MFSLRGSSSSSGNASTAPAPATSSPKFPIYLLPTFAIPFRSRRRRQSSTTTTTTAGYYYGSSPTPHADAVPSLSSTPNSSALSSPVESPATPSLFPSSSSGAATASTDDNGSRRSSVEPLDITTKLTQTQPDTIRCSTCATDFAFSSQIVSKGFTGQFGRAFLVSPPPAYPPSQQKGPRSAGGGERGAKGDLVNIKVGKQETRLLVTGSHVVADIHCAICHVKVGWKYVDAKEESQKYKVGKFILETQRCATHRSWEDVAAAAPSELAEVEARRTKDPLTALAAATEEGGGGGEEEAVAFDSEDEDECEDLFSGTWDPEIAAKRRRRKVNQRSTK
ncbi:hypothetical protein SLS62_008357 [Diatrype stigma]|uniref:Yippee domain-containing protein n=1 Tax=Diatrype stigma TaxID=117547 RepID=A0AAN9ULE7_9PEZI